MNIYEKRLKDQYRHKPNCTMLEYLKMKEENEYLSKMLTTAVDTYEFLINDIADCRSIMIDGIEYRCYKVVDESEGK